MDSARFDHLIKALSSHGSRRTLLSLLAAVPLAGGLAALLEETGEAAGRRHRRKARHRHDPGGDKDNRKGKRQGKRSCAKLGQTLKKGKRKQCCAGLSVDANRRCAAPAAATSPPPTPTPCTGLKPTNTSPTQGLQEAILAAAAGTTLTLCPGTWAVKATVLIAKNLTLVGAGAGQTILDGGRPASGPGGVRVLEITAGATVTLQDLTITKGDATGVGFPVGGGILNTISTVTLVGVTVTGNTAGDGGGLFNDNGTVTLAAGSSIVGNIVPSSGGGLFNQLGTMTLQAGSSVTGNHADPTDPNSGGGIEVGGGTVNLDPGSVVTGNTPDNCSPTIGTCT